MADARVVVADAGPLIALSVVDKVDLLRTLYEAVIVPSAVREELEQGRPRAGWNLVHECPWMQVRSPTRAPEQLLGNELDRGEAEAIALALELGDVTVMLDDLRARRLAARVYHLDVVGSLGVLVRARRAGLINPLRPVLVALRDAGIHLSAELVERALASVGGVGVVRASSSPFGKLPMLADIIEVEHLGGHRLRLKFEDGASGEVDVSRRVRFTGVFAPLNDPAEFARVRVDADLGTIGWPGGADLAPESLYAAMTHGR